MRGLEGVEGKKDQEGLVEIDGLHDRWLTDHYEVALSDPLAATHLARDPSESGLAVLADRADPSPSEDVVSDGEHLVHLAIGEGDAYPVSAGFHLR